MECYIHPKNCPCQGCTESREIKYANTKSRLFYIKYEWFQSVGPCRHCGATENLQADHIDPATKSPLIAAFTNSNGKRTLKSIWNMAEALRIEELAKCQPLCKPCHLKKSAKERSERMKGKARPRKQKESLTCSRK